MVVNVREKSIEEIEEKLSSMNTELNKISYLESALRESGFSYEIKRYLWGKLGELYISRKMYERAAKVISSKAGVEILNKDKVESYLLAGELYAKVGKIEDADEMFVRASRDSSLETRERIKLARKNIYLVCASDLERKGKKASAVKYYERLLKMKIDDFEREQIRGKLIPMYKSLGMFREARMLEGV